MLALLKGPKGIGVSLPSHEELNRSNFRNVVFPSDLEYRTMDKVHKTSDFVCYTQPSKPFRF
jgi:hypothetical protein